MLLKTADVRVRRYRNKLFLTAYCGTCRVELTTGCAARILLGLKTKEVIPCIDLPIRVKNDYCWLYFRGRRPSAVSKRELEETLVRFLEKQCQPGQKFETWVRKVASKCPAKE